MILDNNLEFCDATAVNAAAGTANVGDVIDLGAAAKSPGRGYQLYLVIQVTTAFTSGGSATVAFKLVSDAGATPATDGTETLHVQTDTFAVAALTQGTQIVVPLPWEPNYERYLGLQVVTAVATTTAGAINAFLTLNAQSWTALSDAVN